MAEWEAGYPEPCGGGFWSGRVPALSLAGTGMLHVAYDTNYYGPCEYDEATGTWQSTEFEQLTWRTLHVVSFAQP